MNQYKVEISMIVNKTMPMPITKTVTAVNSRAAYLEVCEVIDPTSTVVRVSIRKVI